MKTVRRYHMRLDVRGYLHRLSGSKREQRRLVIGMVTDGRQATPDEVREWLLDHVAEGHAFVPAGDCDAWDWNEGCLGHPVLQDGDGGETTTPPATTVPLMGQHRKGDEDAGEDPAPLAMADGE